MFFKSITAFIFVCLFICAVNPGTSQGSWLASIFHVSLVAFNLIGFLDLTVFSKLFLFIYFCLLVSLKLTTD